MCRIISTRLCVSTRPSLLLLAFALGLAGAMTLSGAWSEDPNIVIWQKGPKGVKLKQTATLQISEGYRFADAYSTLRVLQAAGEPVSKREAGMITSDTAADWDLILELCEIGYIDEREASRIDPNQLLITLNENLESANQERKKSGKPPLRKFSWEQKPVYRAANHTLEWALRAESQTQTNIQYHLDFLGRKGVVEAKLNCDLDKFNALSPGLKEMLSSLTFNPGQKYSDYTFQSKIATGSMEGLITGETVKKEGRLGFWATVLLILKTILRWLVKLLIIAVIIGAIGAAFFFYKLYSGKPKNAES